MRENRHTTRALRLLFVVLAVSALAQVPGAAAPQRCNDSADVQPGVGEAPQCSVAPACPRAHKGPCKVAATITLEGTGLVGGQMRAGSKTLDGCTGLLSCTYTTNLPLPAGKKTPVTCLWSDGVAAQVKLTCSASVR